DAVARPIEAAEGPFQARDIGEETAPPHADAVHDDLAGDGGAQADLARDLGRREASHAAFENEAADRVAVDLALRPDHHHVGDRGVGDPGLAAGEALAAGGALRPRRHATGIGAVIGLRQAEAADALAGRE